MINRVLFVRRGCPYCAKAKKAVHLINRFLPFENQIEIKDNFEWEFFGFKSHPIMDNFDPNDFDGYPYLYIDGIEIGSGETALIVKILKEILEDELIMEINEENLIV